MRELCVGESVVLGEQGAHTCEYSILIGETRAGDAMLCESYGVMIRVRETGETVRIPNITIRVAQIDALAELLLRNTVTPVTARDVVDDWLATV